MVLDTKKEYISWEHPHPLLTDEQEMRLERIEYDLSILYSSISPVEYELRERVWYAWNKVMDLQGYVEEKSGN